MGWYAEQIVPRVTERVCGIAALRPLRVRAVRGLAGTIVELGFGAGPNLALYPPEVSQVLAVEPSAVARRRAASRVKASRVAVRFVGAHGESIPLESGTCDGALSTFTLCTIPDAARALAEVRRVLRPGGRLHFLEHGLAPDAGVARWQHRLDPWEGRLADGCHLTRDPIAMVERAGFDVEWSESTYVRGPKPWTWCTVGVARSGVAPETTDPPEGESGA